MNAPCAPPLVTGLTVAFCTVSKQTNKFKEAVLPLKILPPYLVAYCIDLGTGTNAKFRNFLIGNVCQPATGSHFGFI